MQTFFFWYKTDIGFCNFVEHEIEMKKGAFHHREGAKCMMLYKSEVMSSRSRTAAQIRQYRALEITMDMWSCHCQIERRGTKILLQLLLPQRGNC